MNEWLVGWIDGMGLNATFNSKGYTLWQTSLVVEESLEVLDEVPTSSPGMENPEVEGP